MIKTLAKSIREYKTPSILSPIFVSFEVILECLMPLVIVWFLDALEDWHTIEEGRVMEVILVYGGALLGMAVLSLAAGMLSGRFAARASAGFAKNLRKDMYYAIQDYSFANIDRFSTSSLVTRQTTDVTNVQMAYMMIIRVAIRCPFMLIFSLIMSFTVNVPISFVFLALVPLLAAVLVFVIFKTHPIFERVFHKYDNMNRSVREDIKGIRVVKSFVREDFEKKKFEAASEDVCKDFTLAERIMAVNTPTMQFCIWLSFLLIFLLAAIITGQAVEANKVELAVTGPDLTALIMYASQILSAVMQLSMVLVMIIIARTSAERIVAVLNEKSSITSPENAVGEVKDGDIVFDNVSFKYSKDAERFALEGVNLHIKSGQTIGILGGTGSSKSTLVNLIPRLYDVSEGAVYVGGVNVKDYDLDALRNKVAMVLQKNVLFSGTIKENLRWGKEDATDDEMLRVCKLACADDFIQSFPDKYDTYIEQGRHQRLGRAEAAFVHRARPPQRPEGAHPRRLDVRRRHQDGRHDPPLLPRTDPQRDQDHHRPARLVGAGRRPDHRHGRRQDRRHRHARGAARFQRDLSGSVLLAEQDRQCRRGGCRRRRCRPCVKSTMPRRSGRKCTASAFSAGCFPIFSIIIKGG